MSKATKSIPLAMHEDTIDRHYGRDANTGERMADPVLDIMKAAAAYGRETGAEILTAHNAIIADQMTMPAAREKRARDVGFTRLQSNSRKIDNALTAWQAERDALFERIAPSRRITPRLSSLKAPGMECCASLPRRGLRLLAKPLRQETT